MMQLKRSKPDDKPTAATAKNAIEQQYQKRNYK